MNFFFFGFELPIVYLLEFEGCCLSFHSYKISRGSKIIWKTNNNNFFQKMLCVYVCVCLMQTAPIARHVLKVEICNTTTIMSCCLMCIPSCTFE